MSEQGTAQSSGELQHREVQARGVRFHLVEQGEGPPVVMLHGWPEHWMCYRDVLPRVAAAGRRAIAVDLPGYGWSGPAPHDWAKEEVAQDVLALLDALDLREGVTLVGHDWGGYIGFKMCLADPARFKAFLALNIPHPYLGPMDVLPHVWRFAYQPLVAFAGIPLHQHTPLIKLVLRRASANRAAIPPDIAEQYAARFRTETGARTARDTYRTFITREAAESRRPEQRRLTVPTLMLFGVDDPAIQPAMVSPRTAKADDYRLELVEDCGHFIADERPELVAQRAIELSA